MKSGKKVTDDAQSGSVWTLRPIGIIRTAATAKSDAPRQPGWDESMRPAVVELYPRMNYEQALKDLEGCERVWLVTIFHKAENWKPLVLPPRGRIKRGVFATRSPHRPNPIGLTCVRLLGVTGLRLTVEDTDLLDGTPVLDIKPYLAYADAFPDSSLPWVDEQPPEPYSVSWQCSIDGIPADHLSYVVRTLRADPLPHPYRRIRQESDATYILSIQRSRFRYRIEGSAVTIMSHDVDLR
ncbi:MAG: tRNA (N6-threonylcarbamoyladenosine(37)-N6)-methyltransferase TrmO [Candidatus Kapabacteria bacterium]|nr:tRNA (N6-threonylcarbamoyladenosine(37)-N6)-methyltransferase TrmO [Candidatus Kapabacteria bacterium]